MNVEPNHAAAAFARQRAAMAAEGLSCPEKAVLLVLAIMANSSGVSWPSLSQLAARASIGRRTAFRALDRLEDLALIGREPVPGKGARYTLMVDWCHSGTGAGAALVTELHSTGARAAPKQPGTPMERKKAAPSPSRRAPLRNTVEGLPELPTGLSEQQWADYVGMRQRMARGPKGRPWSAAAATKAIEKLHRLVAEGHDPGAVLDASVFNGWQGLFPVKDTADGQLQRERQPSAVDLRGTRPDPAIDMLRAAIGRPDDRAEGDTSDRGRAGTPLPAYLRG